MALACRRARRGPYKKSASANFAGLHEVTVIGYDDVAKYWLAKNSWSTGWGDKGFFKVGFIQVPLLCDYEVHLRSKTRLRVLFCFTNSRTQLGQAPAGGYKGFFKVGGWAFQPGCVVGSTQEALQRSWCY